MIKKYQGIILLNDETLYMPQHNRVRLPVRINKETAHKIQELIKIHKLDSFGCLSSIEVKWENDKLIIDTKYNTITKCQSNLYTRARLVRTPICIEKMCRGKCVDAFVRDIIAKNILPELYKDQQR